MTFFVKVHHYENEKLIAVCDGELLGKKIKHNGLDLHVQPRFYGDLEYSKDEVLVEIKNATSFNVMGTRICNLLIEEGYVHPDTIMWIDNGSDKIGHVIVVK